MTLKIKKRLPVFTNMHKSTKNKPQQQRLQTFGCRRKLSNWTELKQQQNNNSIQKSLNNTKVLKDNNYQGDKLTQLISKHIRIFYININGTDSGRGDHTLIQLCQHLKEVGVNIIGFTETNVITLKDTWLEDKIGTCTSESNLPWNSDYKPGRTAIISLNKQTSSIINKGQDPSDLGKWAFITLLRKENSSNTLFTMYILCNSPIELIGGATVI